MAWVRFLRKGIVALIAFGQETTDPAVMPPDCDPGVDPAFHENTVISGIRYWPDAIFLDIVGQSQRQPVDDRHKAGHDGREQKFQQQKLTP
jgi:hypothetical protein